MKKLIIIVVFVILVFPIFTINNQKEILAEVAVVHANEAWQITDIILKEDHTLKWQVKEDDYWSFNTAMFPEGHSADGIPVPALRSYALPGEDIGMLLGKTGEGRVISMGLSGSDNVRPDEGGSYLYLTINDDLLSAFGKGFKDNNGEILVTITQTPRRVAKIGIFFIEGCPGVIPTARHIKEVIAEEAIDAKISLILIETPEDARQLHFTGSPTVRINGKDIESNIKDIKDYALRSRLYSIDGRKSDYPSKDMIRDAIKNVK
ncbi:MAG: hypothetical protein MAG551_00006 [Candidatus Scalindua arabica]|uniref:Uncharacterized protein n=1 Tax=Candidatus Scalindua arabica TaxID=1127984 RepID=A0A941W0P6_9BACT|nr:hypothetical protein [Candidatus Scalindua arabica]